MAVPEYFLEMLEPIVLCDYSNFNSGDTVNHHENLSSDVYSSLYSLLKFSFFPFWLL